MKHLDHLQEVADSDVRVLLRKEATYKGSWKAAGGRSAWFMARRNLDRLLNMMADVPWPEGFSIEDLDAVAGDGDESPAAALTPELAGWLAQKLRAEDIFAKIAEDPSGADGTVLAVIRDARRYFTLVEAEMVARGIVVPEDLPKSNAPWLPRLPEANYAELEARAMAHAATSTQPNSESPTGRLPERRVPRYDFPRPGTPEDGGHHATGSAWPWAVTGTAREWMARPDHSPESAAVYQDRTRGSGLNPLMPFLTPDAFSAVTGKAYKLGRRLEELYTQLPDSQGWHLKVADAPEQLRDYWPRFDHEKNQKEWEGSEAWVRALYAWEPSSEKWLMRPEAIAAGWQRG